MSKKFTIREISGSIFSGYWGEDHKDRGNAYVVRAGDLSEDFLIRENGLLLRHIEEQNVKRSTLNAGDILLTMSGAKTGRTAIVKNSLINNIPIIPSNFIKAIRVASSKVVPKYLFYFMRAGYFWKVLDRHIRGVAMPNLSVKIFDEPMIDLPDVKEQKRIVAILEEAEQLKKKREEANKKMEDVIPALFMKMFGDPATNPMGWQTDDFSKYIKIGTKLVDPKDEPYKLFPQIGGENIIENSGEIVRVKKIKDKHIISNNYLFSDKHILYTKIRPYLNKVAFPGFHGLCSADIYPLAPLNRNINILFVLWLLRSDAFVSYTNSLSQRLRMPKLNRNQLGSYQMIIPPRKLQDKFVNETILIEKQNKKQKKLEGQIDNLFNSLTQKAFNGKL